MDEKKKTKVQLIAELEELRKLNAEQDAFSTQHYLFENSAVGIGVSSKKGRILEANEAMRDLTGYSEKEMSEIDLADTYFNPDDRQLLLKKIKQDGKVENHEIQLINKQGKPYWASLSIRSIIYKGENAFLTTAIDITDRKKTEEELKESERYCHLLLNQLHEDIIVIDKDYRITDINNTFMATTGHKRSDVIGPPLL